MHIIERAAACGRISRVRSWHRAGPILPGTFAIVQGRARIETSRNSGDSSPSLRNFED